MPLGDRWLPGNLSRTWPLRTVSQVQDLSTFFHQGPNFPIQCSVSSGPCFFLKDS